MEDEQSEVARAAMLEVIETQISESDPPETAETMNRLLEAGYPRTEAIKYIGCALADEMLYVLKGEREYDHARYVQLLHRLPTLPWE